MLFTVDTKGHHSFFLTILIKIKIDSDYYLPIEKILSLHNVIILIISVLRKDQNNQYYKVLLEKCSYQLAKK